MLSSEVVVVGAEAFPDQAARRILRTLHLAQETHGRASLALAGGSTPLPVYRSLAAPGNRALIDWTKVDLFWSDERCLPRSDPHSNYRGAFEALLEPLRLDGPSVHPVRTELGAEAAAVAYERQVRHVLGGDPPRFDLVLLGVGEDGHTASLFPADERDRLADCAPADRLVVATRSPRPPTDRVSFSYPLLDAARRVLFLARGAGKAAVLSRLFGVAARDSGKEHSEQGAQLPAARVSAAEVTWLLDDAAAASLVGRQL